MLADQEAEGESGSLSTWKIATKKVKYSTHKKVSSRD